MIVNNKNNDIYKYNITDIKNFKFSNSPIIFKILSDSLYSDKIGSIVRELGSNARDSHIAANKKDIPFDIHIPKITDIFSTNLIFSIKDYGVGLSEEEMFNLYNIYGESNKRDSNDYIGGFGIGSKSPFAYTDTFTIVSRYNGKKTTYSAFINDDGFPAISKIFSEETNECNGVEISFPIKKDDIQAFIDAINRQLAFFDPFPNVNIDVCKPFNKNILDGKNNWFLNQENSYINYNKLYFIIGDIPYKVNEDVYNKFWGLKSSLYIKCPIGCIDLSASREAISYTKKSVDYINARIKDVIQDISYNIKKNLDYSLYNYISYINTCGYDLSVFKDILDENIIKKFSSELEIFYEKISNALKLNKCDLHIIIDGKYVRKKHAKFLYIKPNKNLYFLYIPKKYNLDIILNYINKNKLLDCIVVRYVDEDSINIINSLFYNPEYSILNNIDVERIIKNKNIVKGELSYRIIDNKMCKSYMFYCKKSLYKGDRRKCLTLNELIDVINKSEFTLVVDKKSKFCEKEYCKLIDYYANILYCNDKNNIINIKHYIIIITDDVYNKIKDCYNDNILSYNDCIKKLNNHVKILFENDYLDEYAKIFNTNLLLIFYNIQNNFSIEEIKKYASKNIIFDMCYHLYNIMNNTDKKNIFFTYQDINKLNENTNNSEYNEYIKNNLFCNMLYTNSICVNNAKDCFIKFLNLED